MVERPPDEGCLECLQPADDVGQWRDRSETLTVGADLIVALLPAAAEQLVIEGVLGVEVGVERRRPDADPTRQVPEGQPGDALGSHDVDRVRDDLLARLLMATEATLARLILDGHGSSLDKKVTLIPLGVKSVGGRAVLSPPQPTSGLRP